MNDNILSIAITSFLAVVSALAASGFFSNRYQRRRIGAEARRADAAADVALSDAAIRLLGPYKDEVKRLQDRITELERGRLEDHAQIKGLARELDATKRHARALQSYLVTHYPDAKGVPDK